MFSAVNRQTSFKNSQFKAGFTVTVRICNRKICTVFNIKTVFHRVSIQINHDRRIIWIEYPIDILGQICIKYEFSGTGYERDFITVILGYSIGQIFKRTYHFVSLCTQLNRIHILLGRSLLIVILTKAVALKRRLRCRNVQRKLGLQLHILAVIYHAVLLVPYLFREIHDHRKVHRFILRGHAVFLRIGQYAFRIGRFHLFKSRRSVICAYLGLVDLHHGGF